MSIQCVLDTETLGTSFDSVILSIGAVIFDTETLTITRTFYRNIDIQSCIDKNMSMSGSTIKWWMSQPEEARNSFKGDSVQITEALNELSAWMQDNPFDGIWTNGADFDLPLIRSAFDTVGLKYPLSYRQHRCYRTLRALYDVKLQTHNIKHNALDDATYQANVMMKIITTYGVKL